MAVTLHTFDVNMWHTVAIATKLKRFRAVVKLKKSSQLTGHEIEFSLTLKFFAA
jgi:hypothetical protein